MSPSKEFDIGPLTWVKGEIDSALNAARDSLAQIQADPAQREPLRFAQNHVHQASGALSIVGLDGVTQFADAVDKLLSALAANEIPFDEARIALASRSIAMLGNYISEVAAGAPHQPLRLLPAYQELVVARGGEAPQPSELFFPDLSVRPRLAQRESLAPERAAHELRVLRGRFEKGLLGWLRKPQDTAGPLEMLGAVHRIEQIQALPATRAFWWASIAFFEGLAVQAIAADRNSQRLCRRIDTQMRRLLEGSQVVAERLVRDVLYFVATAGFDSEHARAVRQTYSLSRALPAAEVELSDTLRQPHILRAREMLEHTKEAWNRFCAGAAVALPQFQEHLGELVQRVEPLRLAQIDRLLAGLNEVIAWLRADPLRLSDDFSMEVATSLLVVEQACESPNADPALLGHQVDLLCAQFDARKRGDVVMELDAAPFGEASRRAQDRLFFNQLAREILTNLGQIEQNLDAYFRDRALNANLATLAAPLKQIEGAFTVLGELQAMQLVHDNAQQIAAIADGSQTPDEDALNALAHQLSALGFYVEALKTGPARLEAFLDPNWQDASELEEAAFATAPIETVESQLRRETRETQQLVEALREAPQDEALRQQLVSNFEAIREDAQLVADSTLEQKAREAIASLKSGEASQETLSEALGTLAPAGSPQPSEATSRLLDASEQEVDAELLEIFLEEAGEVLTTIATHRNRVIDEPHDFEALTTVRRGFHTLKGSSRMVGLNEFSEAARHVEMAMNRWLQLERDADPRLVSLVDNACLCFGAWVEQLQARGGLSRDASALIAEAQAVLVSLDPSSATESPAPAAAPLVAASAAAFVQPDAAQSFAATQLASFAPDDESGPASAHSELDLSSTLLELDLAQISSGEQEHTLVDLAATDFEGDALRAFGEEFGADAAAEAARQQAQVLEPLSDGEVDFDFDKLDLSPQLHSAQGEAVVTEEAPVEQEIDLTSSVLGHDFAALAFDAVEPDEVDLAATALGHELQHFDHDAQNTGSDADLPMLADEIRLEALLDTPADEDVSAPVAPPSAPDLSFATPFVAPAPEPEPEPAPEPAHFAEALDADDGDTLVIEEPELDVLTLEDEIVVEPEVAPAEPAPRADEISIGGQTLSRGLYDLYVGESRQLLDQLIEEHGRLAANALRVPTIDAIRAAHTLAGISGTARVEPAYALGKALEHALHRFTDVEQAPEPAQTHVIGTAVLTLDGMLAEVLHLRMPADEPMLVEQLRALEPRSADSIEAPSAPEQPIVETPDAAPVEPVEPVLAAPVAATLALASDADEEAPRLHDELDEQLLPIFFEEADELSVAMAGVLRDMRANPDDAAPRQALARHLHTFKGSARMAGAMRLGQFLHQLESRLEEQFAQGAGVDDALVDELENALDLINAQIAALKNPPVASAEPTPAGTDLDLAEVPEPELLAAPHTSAAAPFVQAPPEAMPQGLPQPVFEALEQAQLHQRAPLRVRADMIDRFVNEAGEVSIARTRIEGELRTLRRSLLDLTENVIRLRNQLREVEIQAEGQMQSRIALAESQHSEFDPLEFDRFTRLQELTRMMAESVGDVTTIQQNLLRNLDAADTALHAQGRLSRDLQQALMSVRMVPFDELSDRLYRVVRQTAKELGKRANLDIQGGSIEIDRSVLDRMTAPIEHLLRNAIAHGIETPEVRAAAGKSEFGQITLRLTQLSNEIALELTDDGRGLDYERILARGRSVGLIGADEEASENRLTQLIFEPGFSTAESVSGVAGRGVGMDVVKNETLSVGGRIEIFSNSGEGSRFLVHLPLTLAVTQALLVRSGERTYAIPSNMVEQALELKEAALEDVRNSGTVEWKGTHYPFTYLPRLLGDTQSQPQSGRYHWVLLVRAGSQTIAVHIDELRGNQEIVVKNAGPQFVRLQGYSGATVLADGEISLILNPVALAARQRSHSQDALASAREEAEAAREAAQTRIPSVMVVDDSLTVRKITSRLLEREGFQVVTAKDGVDALEQLIEYKPDVMLLDIEMPRMDGFDLARNVRADARLRDVPIIMITSRMADKHRNYAMEIGVNHYLGKPYQEEQLLELITGFIAAQRSH